MLGNHGCLLEDLGEAVLDHTTNLVVDGSRDTLHTTSTRQPPNRSFRDALNVVA